MFWRNTWQMLRETWQGFSHDNAFRLAAALSYYTALSLAPLLLVVISIAGMLFGEAAARGEVVNQIEDLIGRQGAEAVESMLAHSKPRDGGIVAGIVGLVTLVIGATGVFAQLQDALNTIWNVDPKQTSSGGIWGMLKDRLLSLSMVCGMAFLLLVSLALSALLSGLNQVVEQWLGGGSWALWFGHLFLSVTLTFGMFAMIFKWLPEVSLQWSDVRFGAAITAVLFTIGKYAIGLYLGHAAVGTSFGAAGSFVVLLTWLYYSSLILLFGAEFTQVYARRHGTFATPASASGTPSVSRSIVPAQA